jgi:hypothetical protein
VHIFIGALDPKKLGLLREVAPHATLVGALLNPNVEDFQIRLADVQEAARTVGQQIHILSASTEGELDTAFAALNQIRAGAVVVSADAIFNSRRDQIVALRRRTKALTHSHPNSQPTQVVIDASPSGVTKERSQSSWRPLQAKRVQTIAQTTAPTPKRPNRATRAASMFHPRISCGRLQEHSVNAAKSSRDEAGANRSNRIISDLAGGAVEQVRTGH